jgi:hypothetical protein
MQDRERERVLGLDFVVKETSSHSNGRELTDHDPYLGSCSVLLRKHKVMHRFI